jgi:exodeoxyribonuclease VII large subunit
VVTSEGSAALRDILAVAARRHPGIPITVVPTTVQGAHAASSIVNALGAAQRLRSCDVVILARGGGSPAELAVFNDESVARAIASCRLPLVCAVGHETDRLLADEAADLRAATPSVAAERTIPDRHQLAQQVAHALERVDQALYRRLQRAAVRLHAARTAVVQVSTTAFQRHRTRLVRLHQQVAQRASRRVQQSRSSLARDRVKLHACIRRRIESERATLNRLTAALGALDPTAVVARGYAIVSNPAGRVVSTVAEAQRERTLRIRLRDGELVVHVPLAIPPHILGENAHDADL